MFSRLNRCSLLNMDKVLIIRECEEKQIEVLLTNRTRMYISLPYDAHPLILDLASGKQEFEAHI
jgi:hypothetical protein